MHAHHICKKFVMAGVAALASLASLATAQARVTVLHAFTGGMDGAYPEAGLIQDEAGNLYGTTYEGGGTGCHDPIIGLDGYGCGTVFKIAPAAAKPCSTPSGGSSTATAHCPLPL